MEAILQEELSKCYSHAPSEPPSLTNRQTISPSTESPESPKILIPDPDGAQCHVATRRSGMKWVQSCCIWCWKYDVTSHMIVIYIYIYLKLLNFPVTLCIFCRGFVLLEVVGRARSSVCWSLKCSRCFSLAPGSMGITWSIGARLIHCISLFASWILPRTTYFHSMIFLGWNLRIQPNPLWPFWKSSFSRWGIEPNKASKRMESMDPERLRSERLRSV